jgi:nucleotide-binding universal stress UspA family protein
MTIVVGVDGSDESKAALRWAVDEGRLRSEPVRAIHAWSYPPLPLAADPFLPGGGHSLELVDPGELREAASAFLAATVADAVDEPDQVEQVVLEGHPAEVLIEAAKEASLLVVGSRGHGGFTGALLGSVSQAAVNHARCTVAVVRA